MCVGVHVCRCMRVYCVRAFLLSLAGSVFAVGAFNTIRLCDRTGVSSANAMVLQCLGVPVS